MVNYVAEMDYTFCIIELNCTALQLVQYTKKNIHHPWQVVTYMGPCNGLSGAKREVASFHLLAVNFLIMTYTLARCHVGVILRGNEVLTL